MPRRILDVVRLLAATTIVTALVHLPVSVRAPRDLVEQVVVFHLLRPLDGVQSVGDRLALIFSASATSAGVVAASLVAMIGTLLGVLLAAATRR